MKKEGGESLSGLIFHVHVKVKNGNARRRTNGSGWKGEKKYLEKCAKLFLRFIRLLGPEAIPASEGNANAAGTGAQFRA